MGAPDQIAALFDRIEAEIGIASILVNNAGIALPGDFLETTLEQFQQVIDVNLTGTFLALQRAAKSMVAEGIEGAVVNMSSINAQVAIPSIAAYCASKGGIMQLTKAAALALAPHNIRVNAVGPGSIDTAMLAGVNADPDAMKMVMSRTPLKRIGTPREIGDVVAFLASPKASYITGETNLCRRWPYRHELHCLKAIRGNTFGRPRINRQFVRYVEKRLNPMCRSQQRGFAPGLPDDLKTDRQPLCGKSAGNTDYRTRRHRQRERNCKPVDIGFAFLTVDFSDVALFHRKGWDRRGRADQ